MSGPGLREALVALRRCFDDDGTLLIKPEASQFMPVDKAEDAESIFDAVDRALAAEDERERAVAGLVAALDGMLRAAKAWEGMSRPPVFQCHQAETFIQAQAALAAARKAGLVKE